jgi:hypothetical protein
MPVLFRGPSGDIASGDRFRCLNLTAPSADVKPGFAGIPEKFAKAPVAPGTEIG